MKRKQDCHQHMKYKSALSMRMIHLDNHCQTGKTKVNWEEVVVGRVRMSLCFGTFHVKVFYLFLPFFCYVFCFLMLWKFA